MNCRQVQRKLNAYLDAQVPADVSAGIERHLAGCPRCSAELARLRRLGELMDQAPAMPVPLGFASSVRARAAGRQAVTAPSSSCAARRLLPVASVAALMLGVAAGGLMSLAVAHTRLAGTSSPQQTELDVTAQLLGVAEPDSVADAFLQLTDNSQ